MIFCRSNHTRYISAVSRKMSSKLSPTVLSDLRQIFLSGLDSVKPHTIFHQNECLKVTGDKLKVSCSSKKNKGDEFNISGKKLHLIGFGKAVRHLAYEVERILKDRLASGIISVPIGSATMLQDNKEETKIKVFEGAKDNFPDDNSFAASQEILERCRTLGENDILLCLISGGGSALLPYPTPPITLREKTEIIKFLSKKGATIDELNTVRIAMSQVKGGKLALAAKNAHQIISLIISDIINDPLDLIASGPTVAYVNPPQSPLEILEKFGARSSMSKNALEVIKAYQPVSELKNVKNYIIANNEIAIRNAMTKASNLGYESVFLSKAIMGDVKDVCQIFERLTSFLINKNSGPNHIINENPQLHEILRQSIEKSNTNSSKGICVISGGEPVVTVNGNGIGGRNQELALRFGHFCTLNDIKNAYLLSAGTDGFDGPGNDAAGAIGGYYYQSIDDVEKSGELIEQFLKENDSYNFYKKFAQEYHVIIGHTGTNVMDLQILVVLNEENGSIMSKTTSKL